MAGRHTYAQALPEPMMAKFPDVYMQHPASMNY